MKCRSKYLPANLSSMLVRAKTSGKLFMGVDEIPKVTETMAKLLDIKIQKADIEACVDEFT